MAGGGLGGVFVFVLRGTASTLTDGRRRGQGGAGGGSAVLRGAEPHAAGGDGLARPRAAGASAMTVQPALSAGIDKGLKGGELPYSPLGT
jgi:hypothetical protein